MTSGNAALPPEELLSDLARLRRQARSARHAYWFPLILFGLLTCASIPVLRLRRGDAGRRGRGRPAGDLAAHAARW